ncbi:MAG: ATP-grasp domain-containing protein [Planctomycetes bacterium]|nr:ATP-grasp domain-containing protein [Planctomycetota bacterium]MCH9727866.1 ATP-grasp domain-containing protein [Planctomycetota bacterium]MCH9775466.1 ATP-grasp domain-containing protein [Planctomycetota bacterium]MCH9793132.1 ATP-grasp domain-containing protein [Planctomycetota bacterium]
MSEYLSSGACAAYRAEPSLLTEGAAMLDAVITDLLAIPDCNVMTCVDAHLPTPFRQTKHWEQEQRLQVKRIKGPEEETHFFENACRQADVAWIIAPEFDDILHLRTERAIALGALVSGSDLNAIKLTADKWRLFEFLNKQCLPTVSTSLFECLPSVPPESWPCVIKHRYGAGGLGLTYFESLEDWMERLPPIQNDGFDYIVQPFVPGTMLSTVVLINSQHREIFPVGEQKICWQSGFKYQGGLIPADLNTDVLRSIEKLLQSVCEVIPGLSGYVGFDLLLPDVDPAAPLLMEINPRLTTSYTGYRQLTSDNLAERIIKSETEFPLISWQEGQSVEFRPDGSVLLNQMRN